MNIYSAHINGEISKYNLNFILKSVSDISGINIEIIKSKSRKRPITEARFAYCLLARKFTKKSTAKIGALVNISHSDVIHSKKVAHVDSIKSLVERCKLTL